MNMVFANFAYMRKFLLSISLLLTAFAAVAQNRLEYPKIAENEIVIHHNGFTLSYNPDWMMPNWAAYELESSDLEGDAVRQSYFSPDPSPELKDYPLAEHWHYTKSGWVRGHMVPAGDLKYSQEAMNDSFYTTNICPMNMEFNNGIWKRLEEKTRKWAIEFGRVYVITGPILGDNKNGKVGTSDIYIPDSFFKAVLIPYENTYYSIGFVLFNEPAPKGSQLRDYALTVDDVEELTGMDFFYALKPRVASEVEKMLPLKELSL